MKISTPESWLEMIFMPVWQPLDNVSADFNCFPDPVRQMQDAMTSVWVRGLLRPIYQDGWMQGADH